MEPRFCRSALLLVVAVDQLMMSSAIFGHNLERDQCDHCAKYAHGEQYPHNKPASVSEGCSLELIQLNSSIQCGNYKPSRNIYFMTRSGCITAFK